MTRLPRSLGRLLAVSSVALTAACSSSVSSSFVGDDYPVDLDVAAKVRRGEISFGPQEGTSYQRAISVLGADDAKEGVLAEYVYIEARLGAPNVDWVRVRQKLISHESRIYDIITVRMSNGSERDFYFDAGDYYGQQRR